MTKQTKLDNLWQQLFTTSKQNHKIMALTNKIVKEITKDYTKNKLLKHFYISYEVEEACPTYNFVIKAQNQTQAEKLARKFIKHDYPESYEYRQGFSCHEITAQKLLEWLTIN